MHLFGSNNQDCNGNQYCLDFNSPKEILGTYGQNCDKFPSNGMMKTIPRWQTERKGKNCIDAYWVTPVVSNRFFVFIKT